MEKDEQNWNKVASLLDNNNFSPKKKRWEINLFVVMKVVCWLLYKINTIIKI